MYVASLFFFFPGTHLRKCFPRVLCLGFPDGPVAENPSANAGDTGSISSPGRSHMHRATKLKCHSYWSLCALESVLCNKGSHHDEKPGHHNWRAGPLSATRESPLTAKALRERPSIEPRPDSRVLCSQDSQEKKQL